MKLKTADLVPLIVKYGSVHARIVFDAGDTSIAAAANVKLWKRLCKKKLGPLFDEEGYSLSDIVAGDCRSFAFDDLLSPDPLTGNCICRHYENVVLEDALDPYVVTDPTDTKVLRIFWHSD